MTLPVPDPLRSLSGDLKPKLQRGVQVVAGHSLNRAAVAALRLGLPVPPYAPGRALVLETFGRRTGKRRLTPMGCLRDGDLLLVVSEHGRQADWLRNALAAEKVRLWLAGKPHQAMVRVLGGSDPEELLQRMGSKVHTATIHAMAHEPCVVEFALEAG
ncbi:MAG: nitroreductase family deazaflavin-dependent oxidoreductase [Actinomycetota bacterium]